MVCPSGMVIDIKAKTYNYFYLRFMSDGLKYDRMVKE